MPEKNCRTLTLPTLLLALVGCSAVGPTHQLPDVSPGSGWMSQADGEIDAKALARWWATLGDMLAYCGAVGGMALFGAGVARWWLGL